MGAEQGCALLRDYMAHYDAVSFEREDGSFYTDTNVLLLTRLYEAMGFARDDTFQEKDGVAVYPRAFFSPYDYIDAVSYITEDSVAIHHFAQFWLPRRVRMKTLLKRRIVRLVGGDRVRKLLGR
jgi:hypothetical protein